MENWIGSFYITLNLFHEKGKQKTNKDKYVSHENFTLCPGYRDFSESFLLLFYFIFNFQTNIIKINQFLIMVVTKKICVSSVFTWTGTHDVAVVNETEYKGCTMVSNVSSTSPVTITLEKTGDHYFICTIGNHCSRGQKLEIEVKASNTTAGSPPSTPTNGTTPSPPPPSSATSFAPVASLCATFSFLVFSFLA